MFDILFSSLAVTALSVMAFVIKGFVIWLGASAISAELFSQIQGHTRA